MKQITTHGRSALPLLLVNLTFALLAASCEKNDSTSSTRTSSANNPSPSATTTTATGAETRTPTTPNTPTMPTPDTQTQTGSSPRKPVVTWKGVGLSTPESVLHDD